MTPELSIIIPTTVKPGMVEACVKSIHNNTLTSYEIIVVANSTNLAFHEKLKELLDVNVKIVHIKKRAGFIVPCNAGAEIARGRYIAVLNDDTTVGIKWARFLLRYLRGDVKQVGPSLKFLNKNFDAVDYCTSHPYIEGWCFIIDRIIYDERGVLFDDKLAWAYCEDADLSTYIMSKGYRVMRCDTDIHHIGTQTARSNKKLEEKCITMEKLNKKYLRKKWKKIL